jgi:mannose-6-phosphate isomerase
MELSGGDSVDIARGVRHRIENIGNESLYYIEVQTGDYFGEDDIERLEDDYGRV